MTTNTLIVLLSALCILLLVSNLALWLCLLRAARRTRREGARESAKSADKEAANGAADMDTEKLVVLLTAAASAALGTKKSSHFRVVSFRQRNS